MTALKGKGSPPSWWPSTHWLIHSFLLFYWVTLWARYHGGLWTYNPLSCPTWPFLPTSQKNHLPGAQCSEQSIIIVQVTRMSSYGMVSADHGEERRAEPCDWGGKGCSEPSQNQLSGEEAITQVTPLWPSCWLQTSRLVGLTSSTGWRTRS